MIERFWHGIEEFHIGLGFLGFGEDTVNRLGMRIEEKAKRGGYVFVGADKAFVVLEDFVIGKRMDDFEEACEVFVTNTETALAISRFGTVPHLLNFIGKNRVPVAAFVGYGHTDSFQNGSGFVVGQLLGTENDVADLDILLRLVQSRLLFDGCS